MPASLPPVFDDFTASYCQPSCAKARCACPPPVAGMKIVQLCKLLAHVAGWN